MVNFIKSHFVVWKICSRAKVFIFFCKMLFATSCFLKKLLRYSSKKKEHKFYLKKQFKK